jgi:hypothetical protein
MTTPTPQYTDFSKDVLGRYVCNGLDEAMASTSGRGGRPFDLIIVGGGSFGATLAQHLLTLDSPDQHVCDDQADPVVPPAGFGMHRILVLEAGPYVLPDHVQNLPVLGLSAPGPTTAPRQARVKPHPYS